MVRVKGRNPDRTEINWRRRNSRSNGTANSSPTSRNTTRGEVRADRRGDPHDGRRNAAPKPAFLALADRIPRDEDATIGPRHPSHGTAGAIGGMLTIGLVLVRFTD